MMPMPSYVPTNVYGSMAVYDPNVKGPQQTRNLPNAAAKRDAIGELVTKYLGQQVAIINIRNNDLMTVEFENVPDWRYALRGRVWATHLLFGDWRIATEEDKKQYALKAAAEKQRIAKMEAERLASAAGQMFKDMASAAKTINEMNAETEATTGKKK